MSDPDTQCDGSSAGPRWFTTTHWSVVLAAGQSTSPDAQAALEKLCRAYWYPLYAYIRRDGKDEDSARDLTQSYFARFLEKNFLAHVQREKGKFRSFLLGSLKHFLSDEREKARAQKRGGGQTFVSFDDATGEDRYRMEPVDTMDAEKLFEHRWALTLLDQARERLKDEYSKSGNAERYDQLKVFESDAKDAPSYAEVAARLEMTESAIKTAISRFRQRFHELVREEVANTVSSSTEVDEEIRHLIRVVSE